MNLELVPENGVTASNQKNGNETRINRKVKADPADNPWHGKFDRRKIPRDPEIVFSVPLAANDGNFGKPESDQP